MANFLTDSLRRTWAEINMQNARHNYNQFKSKTSAKICCVVKADAYGHGAKKMSMLYQSLGADYFAVSNVKEAIELRKAGIIRPILILGYTHPKCAMQLKRYDLTQTIFSYEYFKQLEVELKKINAKIRAHVKIDTGMNRLGFDYKKCKCAIFKMSKSEFFEWEGAYTHFACADTLGGKNFTLIQYERFLSVIEKLEILGVKFKIKHCASSVSALTNSDFHLDMIRVGIGLYGYPSKKFNLKPVMSVKTIISQVKDIKRGDSVGYGREFVAKKKMRVATLAIGYADGFLRSGKKASLIINDTRVKIIGRVCMDMLMIDVSRAKCAVSDVVTIVGEGVLADELAFSMNTISYEVLCAVSKRVARIYV